MNGFSGNSGCTSFQNHADRKKAVLFWLDVMLRNTDVSKLPMRMSNLKLKKWDSVERLKPKKT